jgi:hypothetical protein
MTVQDRIVAGFLTAFTLVVLMCIFGIGWNAVAR